MYPHFPQPPGILIRGLAEDFERAYQGDATALWQELDLQLDSKGRPFPNVYNAHRILAGHKHYAGKVWFDEFHQRIRTTLLGSPPRDWRDSDDAALLTFCQGPLEIPKMHVEAIRQAVTLLAADERRSEPREWINSLEWDSEARLGMLMSKGLGAEDNDYTMMVGENLIKACVARIERPGCKVDAMVVLEGGQGTGKTQAIELLAGPWYGSLISSFGTKDAYLEMRGKLLIEVAELEAMSKRETETVKAFLSRRVDTYRPPYGRHPVDVPRQCVFVGSTNESSYLRDATGGRRFLPIRCGRIDLDWIHTEREQLFAEAAWRVKHGESWWDVPSAQAQREQDDRFAEDPWFEVIDRHLALVDSTTTTTHILTDVLKIETGRQTKREQMRVATILERLGWLRARIGLKRTRTWISPKVGQAGRVGRRETASDSEP